VLFRSHTGTDEAPLEEYMLLGYALAMQGRKRAQAVARRRGLSDAERELRRLRPLVARTPAR